MMMMASSVEIPKQRRKKTTQINRWWAKPSLLGMCDSNPQCFCVDGAATVDNQSPSMIALLAHLFSSANGTIIETHG